MNGTKLESAKALTVDSRSDAIVVSFGFEWLDRLRRRTFSAVIRKRVPRTFVPTWMYVHINAPKSAICARARILALETISIEEGLNLATKLDLSAPMIKEYVGQASTIGLYRIDDVCFPADDISAEEIGKHMKYYAPQSFFALSKSGKRLLDRLGGFRKPVDARKGQQ